MKAVIWDGDISVSEIPEPAPCEKTYKVEVLYGGICGSDITIISGKHPRAKPPLVLGHEFVGIIKNIPSEGNPKFHIGQRVSIEPLISCGKCQPCKNGHTHVCQSLKLIGIEQDGGFTQYINISENNLHALPDDVSDQEATLCEPLAVAVHAINTAKLESFESVLIMGAGPIGLLCAEVAKSRGSSEIYISEVNPYRKARAQKMGYHVVDGENTVEEINHLTKAQGVNVVIEATGVPVCAAQVIDVGAIKARIIMVAIHKSITPILFRDLAYKEQTILGVRVYACGDFKEAIALLKNKKISTKHILTHQFDIHDADKAFAVAKSNDDFCKILIKAE